MTKTKNPLTAWIRDFCRTKGPDANPADAWRYLTEFAPQHGVFPWLVRFDPEAGEVIYKPSPGAAERRISRASFRRQLLRARQIAGFG